MHYFALANMLHSVSSPFIQTLVLLLSFYLIEIICTTNHALEIAPERIEVTYGNEKYLKNMKAFVGRKGRRRPYVIHFEADILQTFGNNVTFSAIIYEYLHNEYKPSFVQFNYRLCDFINKDNFLGYHVRNMGLPCPLLRGHRNLSDVRLYFPVFSYVFPFKSAKAALAFKVTATGEDIATANLYILVKQM